MVSESIKYPLFSKGVRVQSSEFGTGVFDRWYGGMIGVIALVKFDGEDEIKEIHVKELSVNI